ncbi:hypothetical protein OOK31_29620 [Streptomyces sp. NBC_00249]|uniref:hypothetical protein n=1 Tax=Streptomyces sp. NBC_00249 TaxID=2975690 RepID=UPI00224C9E78|nr:hypothetical protein [Streptomyces sp. NBC_00249]MCX5198003.1 hypothetical protein [Streptomyces sp. NBC_00249]
MVLMSPARAYAGERRGGVRRWDLAPGAEVVGAWQLVTVWALLLVTRGAAGGSAAVLGVAALTAAAAGYLHGLLVVKAVAALGRWTARLSAWPEPVAVAVLAVAMSAFPAALVHWWLGSQAPGFGRVWAWTTASAVLPLLAGVLLRSRRVPARVLWGQGAVVAGTAVGVVALAGLVMELPV